MIIYIVAYIVLGISTGVAMRVNGQAPVITSALAVMIWPLYWFSYIFAHFVGWMPGKCAWCGKTVAGHAKLKAWRNHYLDECEKHPLAVKCKRLERYLDETDAKNTANRVQLEEARKQIEKLETKVSRFEKWPR